MRSEPVGRSGLGFARTQCANGEKKNQNLRRGPIKPKRGAHLTRSGVGWSQLRAPGPQNRSGGRKKNLFWGALVPFSGLCTAGTDPGRCRDRMAARLHFGFFSTAGSRRVPASCKIKHLGTKRLISLINRFCPLRWLLEPRCSLL